MSKFYELEIGTQKIEIKDWTYISKVPLHNCNLYAITMEDEPILFISSYFAGVLFMQDGIYRGAGLVNIKCLAKFLEKRKVVFKNCYYDLAYKNKKELNDRILELINKNEDIFIY